MTSKREEVIEVIDKVTTRVLCEHERETLKKIPDGLIHSMSFLVDSLGDAIADVLLERFCIVPFCTCKHISGGTTSMIDSEPRNICVACDRPIGRAREEVK